MVVDSSALVAIMRRETGRDLFIQAISDADERVISALNLFETRTVLHGRGGPGPVLLLEEFLLRGSFRVASFDGQQAGHAFAAYRRYGKGSGHPARLNLGDCAAYALATSLDLPLLFKGDDFRRTDVRPALG